MPVACFRKIFPPWHVHGTTVLDANREPSSMTIRKVDPSNAKDDRYYVVLHNPAGGQYKKVVRGKRAANDHAAEMKTKLSTGTVAVAGERTKTVAQLWEEILDAKRPMLSENTLRSYSRDWRNHIKPAMGHLRVAKLTNGTALTGMLNKIEAGSGRAARYAVEAQVRYLLKTAVREGLLPRNPLDGIKFPKKIRVKGTPILPTFEDARRLYDHVGGYRKGAAQGEPEMNQAALAVLIGLGLRASEACGLSVDDFDLVNKTVTIRRQCLYVANKGYIFGPPKTDDSGYRTIPAPQFVLKAVAATRLRNGTRKFTLPWEKADAERKETHELIFFSKRNDIPFSAQRLWQLIDRGAETLGIEGLHPHTFRHRLTTTLHEAGVPQIVIDEITGHLPSGSLSMTVYTQATTLGREKARATIEAAWANSLTDDQGTGLASIG
jgi:integrase